MWVALNGDVARWAQGTDMSVPVRVFLLAPRSNSRVASTQADVVEGVLSGEDRREGSRRAGQAGITILGTTTGHWALGTTGPRPLVSWGSPIGTFVGTAEMPTPCNSTSPLFWYSANTMARRSFGSEQFREMTLPKGLSSSFG